MQKREVQLVNRIHIRCKYKFVADTFLNKFIGAQNTDFMWNEPKQADNASPLSCPYALGP